MASSSSQAREGVEPLLAPLSTGLWTQPASWLRGGFRFLTIASTADALVTLSNVSCFITFMPHVDNLRDYGGYFYAKDPGSADADFLTKLWYAGAYTVQTNIIAADQGRAPAPPALAGTIFALKGGLCSYNPVL